MGRLAMGGTCAPPLQIPDSPGLDADIKPPPDMSLPDKIFYWFRYTPPLVLLLWLGATILVICGGYQDRRRWLLVTATAFFLAGYITYDLQYLADQFRMRDASSVRLECEKMMQAAKDRADGPGHPVHLKDQTILQMSAGDLSPFFQKNLSLPFSKIGATYVEATSEGVMIYFFHSELTGSGHGFLYRLSKTESPHSMELRRSWHRDFAHFVIHGE